MSFDFINELQQNLSIISTETLYSLLGCIDRELKSRTPKHPVSLLKEWEEADINRSVNYFFQRRFKNKNKKGWWKCIVVLSYGKDNEVFSEICFSDSADTTKKRLKSKSIKKLAKHAAASKAIKESRLYSKDVETESTSHKGSILKSDRCEISSLRSEEHSKFGTFSLESIKSDIDHISGNGQGYIVEDRIRREDNIDLKGKAAVISDDELTDDLLLCESDSENESYKAEILSDGDLYGLDDYTVEDLYPEIQRNTFLSEYHNSQSLIVNRYSEEYRPRDFSDSTALDYSEKFDFNDKSVSYGNEYKSPRNGKSKKSEGNDG
jgi:hypothetical protein